MKILAVTYILTALLAALPENPNPWQDKGTTKGTAVYVRDVPDSKVREVKAVAVIPAPIERVAATIADAVHYPEFMSYTEEVQILETISPNEFIIYQRIAPPIVDERDYVYHFVIKKESPEKIILSWTPVNDRGPAPKKKVVRLTVNYGSWTLEAQGKNATKVTYWLYTNPGGSIPAWATNKANTTSLPDVLKSVRERTLNPNWKTKK